MNRIDLEGRAAIVTGAARGIGRAIAERLAASGASVAIWDVDARAAAETARSIANATACYADVTDPRSKAGVIGLTSRAGARRIKRDRRSYVLRGPASQGAPG